MGKPRRVFVALELETGEPLSALRDRMVWGRKLPAAWVVQAQANVAQRLPAKRKRRPSRKA